MARVSARVSTPARPMRPLARSHASKRPAERKWRVRHVLAHDAAEREGLVALDVLGIGADIADVREGEVDDLPRIGGIGHHLLIAGHGGVEAHLAHGIALGAESPAPDSRTIGENENAGGSFGSAREGIGHRRGLSLLLGLWAGKRPGT